jgi:hypothetical protein
VRGDSPDVTEQRTDVLIPSFRLDPKRKGFITGLSIGTKRRDMGNNRREEKRTGSTKRTTNVNEMREEEHEHEGPNVRDIAKRINDKR